MMRLTEILIARIITIGKTTITNLSRVYGFNPYNSPWHHLFSRYRISLWSLSFAFSPSTRDARMQFDPPILQV